MKTIKFFLGFSFFLLLQGSSSCNQAKDTVLVDPELLLNCWTHVHEEVVEEGRYFQPCDFATLPPSRFRANYDFQEGGVCVYAVLAPNDAHYSLTGTWEYNSENAHIMIYDADHLLVNDFEVLELTENSLIINP